MEGDSAVPGMTRATKTDTKILRLTSPDYRGGLGIMAEFISGT